MDGRLDEPAWEQAPPITAFIQNKPRPGYGATEETVVRILYDDEKLYLGAILYDSEPEKITANSLKREFPSGDEDTFGVLFDTFLDRRNGFMFGVNPNGALHDGQVTDDGRDINFAWEGLVERAASVHDRGWTVELAVPFTTLRFDPTKDEQIWGMNLIRRIKRKNEDAYWAPIDRRFALNRVSRAGTLRGLRGIRSRLNLMVKPYVLAAGSNGVEQNGRWSGEADSGVDAKYGITRRLTVDLTFRTDFSQVEVDEVQIKLTLFFTNVQMGALFLNRQVTDQTAGSGYNRSFGSDLNVRLFRSLIIHSYLAGTWDGVSEGKNRASRLSAAWRDRLWDASAMYPEIDDAFNPQLGFVRRRGIRQGYGTVGMHLRPRLPFLIEVNPYVELDHVANLKSVLETRTATLGFDVDFTDGGVLDISYKDRLERLLAPFEVLSQAQVPPGTYDFAEASIQYQSTRGRAWSGRVRIEAGGFFEGTKRTVELGGLWKTSAHFSVEVTAQHHAIDLMHGSFTTDVVAGRFEYAYSTSLFGGAFVQYNGAANEWITNVRLNWIHAPLSDLFLLYTERREGRGGEVVERHLAAKLTRLFSL